jgi:hypothetical protein
VLLSKPAMTALRETLGKTSGNGQAILDQTVSAISTSMESSLRIVFIISAITMLLTFLIICTIPEIPIDKLGDGAGQKH